MKFILKKYKQLLIKFEAVAFIISDHLFYPKYILLCYLL